MERKKYRSRGCDCVSVQAGVGERCCDWRRLQAVMPDGVIEEEQNKITA
jgi:hypothetical protein